VNTTVIGDIKINSGMAQEFVKQMKKETTSDLEKPQTYWDNNRLGDSLSTHEKSIYVMVDSLKHNPKFVFGSKVINLLGTGYWDFDNKIRLGPYYSFLSTNSVEGWRFRSGLWTLQGFNKKINLNGYIAYGTKDQQAKGGFGIKYLWNAAKWTKTSIYASSDYDYITDEDQELDEDNLINSYFRKNIPTTRIYLKQIYLKHEQYVSKKFSINGTFIYKELTPVFEFSYHPLSKENLPIDSITSKTLPVTEASIGLRFVAKERTVIWNFDQVRAETFDPILTANFTQGFKSGNSGFSYQKLTVGIQQLLRLPPKSLFYYNIHAGKTFGTAPYLLLNIPAGNEYYVASRYLFNTMLPYEFATDEYVSLYSRLYLGGIIFNKIPFLRKLGWRTRFSYNAFQGDMSQKNRIYNKDASFKIPDMHPFMEAGVGIENIFHVFSVDYYKRLSALNNSKKENGSLFLGVNITF
jgi:hypothetical protein